MSTYQDCANLIIEIMTYSSKDNQIANECKLNSVIESMLIFIDYDDLIDIFTKRVIPRLLPKINERWYDWYTNKLEFFEQCLNDNE